jgi:hypothetical protein
MTMAARDRTGAILVVLVVMAAATHTAHAHAQPWRADKLRPHEWRAAGGEEGKGMQVEAGTDRRDGDVALTAGQEPPALSGVAHPLSGLLPGFNSLWNKHASHMQQLKNRLRFGVPLVQQRGYEGPGKAGLDGVAAAPSRHIIVKASPMTNKLVAVDDPDKEEEAEREEKVEEAVAAVEGAAEELRKQLADTSRGSRLTSLGVKLTKERTEHNHGRKKLRFVWI